MFSILIFLYILDKELFDFDVFNVFFPNWITNRIKRTTLKVVRFLISNYILIIISVRNSKFYVVAKKLNNKILARN